MVAKRSWHDERMRVRLQSLPRWAWFLPGPVLGLLLFGGFLVEHPGDWRGALYPGVTGLVLFTLMWGFLGPVAFGRRERGSRANAPDREGSGSA
jgi:hypothetical protein